MPNHFISFSTKLSKYDLISVVADSLEQAIASVQSKEGVFNVASADLDIESSDQQETMLKALFKTYPKAIKATFANIKEGDILCNCLECGCLVVTKEMLEHSVNLEYFYKVGETHNSYKFLGNVPFSNA